MSNSPDNVQVPDVLADCRIVLHFFVGPNDGSVSCDYRGDNYIGHKDGDEHAAIKTWHNPTQAQVDWVLANGPGINAGVSTIESMLGETTAEISKYAESFANQLLGGSPDIAGKVMGIRIGVWPLHDPY